MIVDFVFVEVQSLGVEAAQVDHRDFAGVDESQVEMFFWEDFL